MKQPYIILYIWLYDIIYIYTVQDWLGFWIFPWYVFLVIRTRNRTTSRTCYSWKLLLLGPRVQFQDLPPDCTGLWNDVWRADRHLGLDLPEPVLLLAAPSNRSAVMSAVWFVSRTPCTTANIRNSWCMRLLSFKHSHCHHQFATITFLVA